MGLDPSSQDVSSSTASATRGVSPGFRLLLSVSAGWAFLTILLGAGVTFTGSGLSCPSWPGCFSQQVLPQVGGASVIEFAHRASALVLSLLTLAGFLLACMSPRVHRGLRNLTALGFLLVVAQALLGGAIIFSQEATAVVIAHLGLAVLLFGVLLLAAFVAEFPYLPVRWQVALVGRLSPVREAREELESRASGGSGSGAQDPPAETASARSRSTGRA